MTQRTRSTRIDAIFRYLDASSSGTPEHLIIVKRTILNSFLLAFSDEQLVILTHRLAGLAPESGGEDFPGWVKTCRLALGLTQAELADVLKMSQSDLSNLESRSTRLVLGPKRTKRIKNALSELISKQSSK